MNKDQIERLFSDVAYVRTGGSAEELRAARYLQERCRDLGVEARLEAFEVNMATVRGATLTVDGQSIPCEGYLCAGSGEVEAELYYLRDFDKYSLSCCRGKIVLFEGYVGHWKYCDLLDHGAVGFVTFYGDVHRPDRAIDCRELRSFYIGEREKIPCVHIHAKDAVALVKKGGTRARITLSQEEYKGDSHNVIADLAGTCEEQIVFTAHYDTTSLSLGAYDNLSGCIGLLSLIEHFRQAPHRYSLRFIFCGSEERGLLGSKAYCAAHEKELEKAVLVINLDMIGSIMGKFIACATAELSLAHYVSYLGAELGFAVKAYQDVYSSDSTPFADRGIPAITFARDASDSLAPIHTPYDTDAVMKAEQLLLDVDFIRAFASRMANAALCPVAREIPENVREKLDEYLLRKRPRS